MPFSIFFLFPVKLVARHFPSIKTNKLTCGCASAADMSLLSVDIFVLNVRGGAPHNQAATEQPAAEQEETTDDEKKKSADSDEGRKKKEKEERQQCSIPSIDR